jgi:hypothetical protein
MRPEPDTNSLANGYC